MKQSYKIFMTVAEEMSIVKAARRSFVTQQCVSDHIKRLEEEYGIALFNRKPHLSLTEAGEIMFQYLKSTKILETNMERTLEEMARGRKGSFSVGLSTSRAQIILPMVLPKYYELFPEVEISFYVNDTVVLEKALMDSEVDLFLGVNASQNSAFCTRSVAADKLQLIINEHLFHQYFGNKMLSEFYDGVELSAFSEVPFSLYYETGAMNIIIRQHLQDYGISLKKTPYHISDCDTLILLCSTGLCAALVPKMLSLRVHEHNAKCGSGQKILIFPIKNFHYPLRVELIWHKHINQPFYVKAFCDMVAEAAGQLMRK